MCAKFGVGDNQWSDTLSYVLILLKLGTCGWDGLGWGIFGGFHFKKCTVVVYFHSTKFCKHFHLFNV